MKLTIIIALFTILGLGIGCGSMPLGEDGRLLEEAGPGLFPGLGGGSGGGGGGADGAEESNDDADPAAAKHDPGVGIEAGNPGMAGLTVAIVDEASGLTITITLLDDTEAEVVKSAPDGTVGEETVEVPYTMTDETIDLTASFSDESELSAQLEVTEENELQVVAYWLVIPEGFDPQAEKEFYEQLRSGRPQALPIPQERQERRAEVAPNPLDAYGDVFVPPAEKPEPKKSFDYVLTPKDIKNVQKRLNDGINLQLH